MTVAQFYKETAGRLASALGKSEGEAAARIIFEDTAGYDRNYIFMNGDREILDFMQDKIADVSRCAHSTAGDSRPGRHDSLRQQWAS